jgi:hypothetical protein
VLNRRGEEWKVWRRRDRVGSIEEGGIEGEC